MKKTGSWMKLEGRMAFHHKVVGAGNAAVGAWARMGAWSAGEKTDGAIPSAIAFAIASTIEIDALLAVGLLEQIGDTSYKVHDFEDYNITTGEWSKLSDKRARAGALGAKRRWQRDGKCHPASDSKTHGKCHPKIMADPDDDKILGSGAAEAALTALRGHRELSAVATRETAEALALEAFDHGKTTADIADALRAAASAVRVDQASGRVFDVTELGRLVAGFVRRHRRKRGDGPTSPDVRVSDGTHGTAVADYFAGE